LDALAAWFRLSALLLVVRPLYPMACFAAPWAGIWGRLSALAWIDA